MCNYSPQGKLEQGGSSFLTAENRVVFGEGTARAAEQARVRVCVLHVCVYVCVGVYTCLGGVVWKESRVRIQRPLTPWPLRASVSSALRGSSSPALRTGSGIHHGRGSGSWRVWTWAVNASLCVLGEGEVRTVNWDCPNGGGDESSFLC